MKFLVFLAVLLLVAAQSPKVIGHRGACGIYPEHTYGSYQEAIHSKADYIEMDLVITKDNQLLVSHNADLGDVTNVASLPQFESYKRSRWVGDAGLKTTWFAEDFTIFELKNSLLVKQRYPKRQKIYDGLYHMMPFRDSLQFLRGNGAGIYMETKHPAYFRSIGKPLEEVLLRDLIEYEYIFPNMTLNPSRDLFIESFESTSLKWFFDRVPGIQLVQLVKERLTMIANDTGLPYSLMMSSDGLDEVKKYAQFIGPNKATFDKAKVDEIHSKGMKIHMWTLKNDDIGKFKTPEEEAQYFIGMGVDGIFADWPALLVGVRDKVVDRPYILYGIVGIFLFIGGIFLSGLFVFFIFTRVRKHMNQEKEPLIQHEQ